jgi:hypothetical protein
MGVALGWLVGGLRVACGCLCTPSVQYPYNIRTPSVHHISRPWGGLGVALGWLWVASDGRSALRKPLKRGTHRRIPVIELSGPESHIPTARGHPVRFEHGKRKRGRKQEERRASPITQSGQDARAPGVAPVCKLRLKERTDMNCLLTPRFRLCHYDAMLDGTKKSVLPPPARRSAPPGAE